MGILSIVLSREKHPGLYNIFITKRGVGVFSRVGLFLRDYGTQHAARRASTIHGLRLALLFQVRQWSVTTIASMENGSS